MFVFLFLPSLTLNVYDKGKFLFEIKQVFFNFFFKKTKKNERK